MSAPQRDRDRDVPDTVRKFASAIARWADPDSAEWDEAVDMWEDRLRALLAEREASVARLARESVLSVVRAVRDERCGVLSPGAREILSRMGEDPASAQAGEEALEQPARDPAVRELAEEIVKRYGVDLSGLAIPAEDDTRADWIEARIRAFLAEQEGEQAGALAALRGALEEAREAIASLPKGALGEVRHGTTLPTGEAGELVWPIRDALVDRITCILQSRAGRAEAEVLRAAVRLREVIDAEDDAETTGCTSASAFDGNSEATESLFAAVDALLAARGGEG